MYRKCPALPYREIKTDHPSRDLSFFACSYAPTKHAAWCGILVFHIARYTAASGTPLEQWTIIIPSLKTALRTSCTFSFRFLWILVAKRTVSCIGFILLDALEDDRDQDSSKLVNVSPFQSFKVRLPRSIIRELIDSSQSILKESSKRYHKIDRHWRFSGTRSIRRQRVAEFSGHPN